MNTENIYHHQQQQNNTVMHQTLNGNSFQQQEQLTTGMGSMSINAPPTAKRPQPPQQFLNQNFPPQIQQPQQLNQKISNFNGLNTINNNAIENTLKNSNLPHPPLSGSNISNMSYQTQSISNTPIYSTNDTAGDLKSQGMPPPPIQSNQPQLVQHQHPVAPNKPSQMSNPYLNQRPLTGQPPNVNNQQNFNYPTSSVTNQLPPQNQNSNFPPQLPNMVENKSMELPPPPPNQNIPSSVPPMAQPHPQQGYYVKDQMNQQRSMPPPPFNAQQRYPNMPGAIVQQPHMPPLPLQTSNYQSQPQPQSMMPPPPGMSGLQGERNFNHPPGAYNSPYQQSPPPQRRLDPDQMPNPIQVIAENQQQCGGVFITNQTGLLPPLVTTKYITQDQGNSSPRFIRSSLYNIPATADILKQTGLCFALIISPFAKTVEGELEPPIVDFGELGPIRCIRCKAYMSPNMQFIDAGRRFQCLLCKATTEVPTEYFQHLDHTGQRVDKYERPELVLGTYEFVATKDYCRENIPPNPPAFIFVIDVSYNNVKSGLVHLLCRNIKEIISKLPIDKGQLKTKMKVGFITYNNVVHFYNIKSSLAQPQMMVVGDTQEMFMPLLDGFLCDPEESAAVIDSLMEQIPIMFSDTKETETILLPAIQAGLEALKASNCPGKLLVFNSSLPIAEAPGKLRNRDDRKLLGTEKEKTILTPQTTAYNQLGQDCVQAGCSVDLFVFNNSYIDIATIGQVSRLTGGEVYKYTYFQADVDGERLIKDICMNISKPIAFDGVMRVRTSAGVRPTDFYGHFFMSNTTDLELASIDCNKAIAIEIKHDDKLASEDNVYIQAALLYTSCGGQRRLRIMNLALNVTSMISEVFRSCDLDALILYFAKQSMFKLMESTPKAVKDNLIHRSAQILACYRKNCTSPTSAGQLILPECLKLLPLYISCLIKNDAFSGGSDMTCDDRSHVIQFVLSMDLPISVFYFYPRLIPIHNIELNVNENLNDSIPLPIRCTYEKMRGDGAYILENGIHMFIWIGLETSPEFLKALFGVQSIQQVNTERFQLSLVPDSPLVLRIKQITDAIKVEKAKCMRITVIRQNDKLETVFKHYLIEDSGSNGSSYVDFLCHMHKEIKELLS